MSQDPFAATPAKMLPFAQALAADVEAGLQRGLGASPSLETLCGAAGASHQYYEQTWRYVQSLHVVPHACRAGCAFCCHLTVEASAPEVFLIAAHLRATLTADELAQTAGRVRATASQVAGLTPKARAAMSVPCALLQNGVCSVYAVRPLGCRSWNSRDAGVCAEVLANGESGAGLRLVQDQRPFGIEAGVRTGFAAAMERAGFAAQASRRYELNAALAIVLDDPSASRRWLAGMDVLAGVD